MFCGLKIRYGLKINSKSKLVLQKKYPTPTAKRGHKMKSLHSYIDWRSPAFILRKFQSHLRNLQPV